MLLDAIEGGRTGDAISTEAHCSRPAGTGSTRWISHRYKLVCFRVTKAASLSLRTALEKLDPDLEAIKRTPLDDFYGRYRRKIAHYFTFSVMRHPLDRLQSCWQDKISGALKNEAKERLYVTPYHGLSSDISFPQVCRWVTSPWGSDGFSNEHWVSQHRLLVGPDGTRPDFIGHYENLEEDWRTVIETIGAPYVELPRVNMSRVRLGDRAWKSLESGLLDRLTERCLEDFELGNYSSG